MTSLLLRTALFLVASNVFMASRAGLDYGTVAAFRGRPARSAVVRAQGCRTLPGYLDTRFDTSRSMREKDKR